MVKKHVMVTIEHYLYDEARERGLNISGLCEDMLRTVMDSFNSTIDPETCKHSWTWAFSTSHGMVKECKLCGALKKIVLETYEETMRRADKTMEGLEETPINAETNTQ